MLVKYPDLSKRLYRHLKQETSWIENKKRVRKMRMRTLLFSSLSVLPRCLLWNPGRRTTAWREGGLRGKATASPLNTVPQPKHGHEQQKTLRGSEKSASVQFKVKTSTFLGRFTALGRISRAP